MNDKPERNQKKEKDPTSLAKYALQVLLVIVVLVFTVVLINTGSDLKAQGNEVLSSWQNYIWKLLAGIASFILLIGGGIFLNQWNIKRKNEAQHAQNTAKQNSLASEIISMKEMSIQSLKEEVATKNKLEYLIGRIESLEIEQTKSHEELTKERQANHIAREAFSNQIGELTAKLSEANETITHLNSVNKDLTLSLERAVNTIQELETQIHKLTAEVKLTNNS